jgi:hypothetical protein
MVAMCGRFPTGGWDVKGLGPGLVGCWKGLDFCGDFFEIGRLRGRAGSLERCRPGNVCDGFFHFYFAFVEG